MDGKPKAYQEIKHSHQDNPTRLQEKTCDRCKYDKTEKSLQEHIKNHTGKEKTKAVKPGSATILKDYTFSQMKVHRGRFDDVIGWTTNWQ